MLRQRVGAAAFDNDMNNSLDGMGISAASDGAVA